MMLHGYISLFLIFIIATGVLYLPIFFILKKSRGVGFIRRLNYLFCFWSLFFVIFTTLILFNLPIDFNPERHVLNLTPLQWLWEGDIKQRISSEICPNIIIFIPLGFFIPASFWHMRKFYKTALAAFIITFSIEFFQYFIGRSSDIDDLIANLFGAIIGYGIFKFFNFSAKLYNYTAQ